VTPAELRKLDDELTMKTRTEVARFVESQFHWSHRPKLKKGGQWHYGKQNVRELLDFIYCGEPKNDEEKVFEDWEEDEEKDM